MDKNDNVLRQATPDDLLAIASLYCTLWRQDLAAQGLAEEAMLCSKLSTAVLALRSPHTVVATDIQQNGRVVGACFAGLAGSTNEAWRADYERLLAAADQRAQTADKDLEASLYCDVRELAVADRFIASESPFAQAEISLLMLHPDCQGLGVGRKLMNDARAKLASAGATAFFLMTDTESDWRFYEHLGMQRLHEQRIPGPQQDFVTYIYGGHTA